MLDARLNAVVQAMMAVGLDLHSALSVVRDDHPAQPPFLEDKIRKAVTGLDAAINNLQSVVFDAGRRRARQSPRP